MVSIYYRSIHSVIIKLYCICQGPSKSLSSELATGVRNWRQIVVFDFDPLGSNRKCNATKLTCIFKTNTLLINLCTINFAISISNVGSSHRREPYPEPVTLVYEASSGYKSHGIISVIRLPNESQNIYLHFLCNSLNELLQLFCSLSPHKLQILSDSSPR